MAQTPDIYSIYQTMERDHIILSFKGHITKELLDSVYQIMESRMQAIDEDPKRKKKVYNILVESLQNIYHHMDVLQQEENNNNKNSKDAMFMIVRGADGIYFIHTGNYVLNSKCGEITKQIEKVNNMSPEELRNHYVHRLSNAELSDKGGAGLGIIDIARKSGNKLEYNVHRVSEEYSFFSLIVSIN